MKRKMIVSALSLVLLMSHSALADVPDEITYQGRLLYNGNPVTSATSIVFRLYQISSGGSAVWTETHGSVTPDSNGIYTVVLGETVAVPDDYDVLWLELAVAGSTLSPRKQLTSAPFVLRAGTLADLYVTGNVGIGIAAPAGKLEVSTGGSGGQQGSFGDDIAGSQWISVGYRSLAGKAALFGHTSSSGIAWMGLAGDSVDNGQGLIVKQGGNVGIGTTIPGAKLEIASGVSTHMILDTSEGAGNNTIRFTKNSTGQGRIGYDDASGFNLWNSNDNKLVTVTNSGLVGIGTSEPDTLFHVNGNAHFSAGIGIGSEGPDPNTTFKVVGHYGTKLIEAFDDNAMGTPRFTVTRGGSVLVGGATVHASDLRLKDDIATMENALELVSFLRGVSFNWKQDLGKDPSRQMGLIAQEVEEVIPQVVHTFDNAMGTKGVAYGQLVAVLVEAVKELKSENEARERQNRALNERIEALEEIIGQ